jgi:hypothetical protein
MLLPPCYPCRYKDAEKSFRTDAKLQEEEEEVSLSHHVDPDQGLVQGLLFSYAAENEPEVYVKQFDQFAGWVDNSLDLYRVSRISLNSSSISGSTQHQQHKQQQQQQHNRSNSSNKQQQQQQQQTAATTAATA